MGSSGAVIAMVTLVCMVSFSLWHIADSALVPQSAVGPDGAEEESLDGLLLKAAEQDQHNSIQTLLDLGADLEARTGEEGLTGLHLAAREGNLESVRAFVAAGLDVNVTSSKDRKVTPLYLAAERGRLETCRFLLESGSSLYPERDYHLSRPSSERTRVRWSPLQVAAFNGHSKVVELLLEFGCDVDYKSQQQETALFLASEIGNLELVEMLLEKGANHSICRLGIYLPLYAAAEQGGLEVVKALLSREPNATEALLDPKCANGGRYSRTASPLEAPLSEDRNEVLEFLLSQTRRGKKGGQKEEGDEEEDKKINELLFEATSRGATKSMGVILDFGADVNATMYYDKQTPLHMASERGNLTSVKLLVERGAHLDARNDYGERTPLYLASMEGHADVVSFLLASGANMTNIETHNGETGFYIASERGHLEVVEVFLSNGIDINTRSKHGYTALFGSSYGGHEDVLGLLLACNASYEVGSFTNFRPIHAASKNNHVAVVERLLDEGEDVNVLDDDGRAPLSLAAQHSLDIVRTLVERGADVNVTSKQLKWTPLYFAALAGKHPDVVEHLLQKGAFVNAQDNEGKSVLLVAVEKENEAIVGLLVRHGADLNMASNNGWTPLLEAGKKRNVKILKFLLEKGSDMNVRDEHGWSPLFHLASYGDEDGVNLLLQFGARVDIVDYKGNTALNRAVNKGHEAAARLLIEAGIDVDKYEAESPLQAASRRGDLETVTLLLKANASKTFVRGSNAPLHLAVEKGNADVAKALLRSGRFDLNARMEGRDSETPLFLAVKQNDIELTKALLKASADVSLTYGKRGWTVLHQAAKSAGLNVLKVLFKNGASVNALTTDGQTALCLAKHAYSGESKVAFLKKKSKAERDCPKRGKYSPGFTRDKVRKQVDYEAQDYSVYDYY